MATVNGRAYYTISQRLKEMDLEFSSLTPEELYGRVLPSSLIITTDDEKDMIKHDNILLVDELDNDTAILKARIMHSLSNCNRTTLIIGIDPGKRIGLSILYNYEEIDSRVVSIYRLGELIEMLITYISAEKRLIRIGKGNLSLALRIADELSERLNDVEIELVDEHGTSKGNLRRDMRDKISARMIALRKGIRFGDGSYTRKIDRDLTLSR